MTTTTGTCAKYIPQEELEKVLRAVRLGDRFAAQHRGARPGFFARWLEEIAKELPAPTFAHLLYRLDLEAAKRERDGEAASPIEKVDRSWQLITYHHPRKGRVQMAFGTLRNKFASAKK